MLPHCRCPSARQSEAATAGQCGGLRQRPTSSSRSRLDPRGRYWNIQSGKSSQELRPRVGTGLSHYGRRGWVSPICSTQGQFRRASIIIGFRRFRTRRDSGRGLRQTRDGNLINVASVETLPDCVDRTTCNESVSYSSASSADFVASGRGPVLGPMRYCQFAVYS